jgi:hypothetical protein
LTKKGTLDLLKEQGLRSSLADYQEKKATNILSFLLVKWTLDQRRRSWNAFK